MMRRLQQLLQLLLALAVPPIHAEKVLKQIHVITRHGSRFELPKDSHTLQEGTSSALTPLGERQHFELGQWLRSKYDSLLSDSSDRVRLESSSFDRTIVSANSLALGLFETSSRQGESLLPVPVNLPVYTYEPTNDVYIRAYDKCPNGLKLAELYQSDEWKRLESEYDDLLRKLATMPDFRKHADNSTGMIPLHSIWNVFDLINVAQTECQAETSACTDQLREKQTLLDQDSWQEVQLATHQAELLKYGRNNAQHAQLLIQRILERMQNDAIRFYLYSAHYPTILGVLGSLQPKTEEFDVIPEYASALVFELYQDSFTNTSFVQVLYKSGTSVTAQNVPICDGLSPCQHSHLSHQYGALTYSDWCHTCGNTKADVCLQSMLDESVCLVSSGKNQAALALAIVLPLVVIVLGLVCLYCSFRRRRSTDESPVIEMKETESTEEAISPSVSRSGSEESFC